MNVVGIILLVALAALVTWLVVDTTIYIVKKAKLKKQEKDKKKLDDSNSN